jgi:hypothetical protein
LSIGGRRNIVRRFGSGWFWFVVGFYFARCLKELRPFDNVNVAAEMRRINPVKGVFRVFFGVYPSSSSTRTGSLGEEAIL